MAEQILQSVSLSLKVAFISSLLVFFGGVTLARIITRIKNFPGRHLVEGFFTLPLILPPTVVGFGLLLLFGKHGPLGKILEHVFHVQVIFNWWAGVLASSIISFPLMYQSAKGALESINSNLEKAARTLGAGELRVFLTITLPLAWPGIMAGLVLAFARALGEFGATLMLAGNIPGRTQTLPLAIYDAVESGNLGLAAWLVGVITIIAFAALYLLNLWSGKIVRPQG